MAKRVCTYTHTQAETHTHTLSLNPLHASQSAGGITERYIMVPSQPGRHDAILPD